MTYTPVFSSVRADLAADFVNKFPTNFDFGSMLQQMCNEAGVTLVSLSNIQYILRGQWGPMGQVHDQLACKLKVYCSSVTYVNESKETISCNDQSTSFGISLLYSASQIADTSVSNREEDGVTDQEHFCDSVEGFQNPVTDGLFGDMTGLNQLQIVKSEHKRGYKYQNEFNDRDQENKEKTTNDTLHNNFNEKDASSEDVDIECTENYNSCDEKDDNGDEENNTEYTKLKTTISSICSSLSIAEERIHESKCNDIIIQNVDKTSSNDKLQLEKLTDVKRGRGRPRKYPLIIKEKNNSNRAMTMKKPSETSSIPKKSVYKAQREKIHKKYKTGLKWKTSRLKSKSQSGSGSMIKTRKRGRPKKDPNEQGDLHCQDCDFVAKSRNQLADHKQRVHLATPTKCDICNKVFPNARYMRRHRSSHVQPQHCCDVCGKMYKILKALKDHRKTHEIGYTKPEFPCDMCSKSFCSRYILECHCKSEHFGQRKSFLCSICGKSFTTKHTLIQHSNVHTGSRPYACDICGKSFAYESALRDHKFIHKQEKIFNCEICKKSFRQRSALKMHEKIHKEKKDFTCAECGRGFTQKQALQRHERAHKGDKPFYCKLCGRTFGDASIIRRHMILVHKIHKDSKTWREDIIARSKAVHSQPIMFEQGEDKTQSYHRNTNLEESTDESIDSIHSSDSPTFQNLPEGHLTDLTHNVSPSLPVNIDSTTTPVSDVHSMTLSQTVQPSQTLSSSHVSSLYTVEPMNYHLSTDSVDVSSRYKFTSTSQSVSNSAEENTSEQRYHVTPITSHTRLPRVDSVLSKRLTEMEPPENLSISSLYTYYTNLASQCINVSQYQSYVSTQDVLPNTDHH